MDPLFEIWLIAFLSCCLGSVPFGFAEEGFCCFAGALSLRLEKNLSIIFFCEDFGAGLEPDIESGPSFELLPALSDGKSVSSTGELWNLRVSCNTSVGEDEAQGSCSLLILPATPKRAVAANEERSIYLWYGIVVPYMHIRFKPLL